MSSTPRLVSPQRIAAGAPSGPANAAKSTGPRTSAGRARSAQNARKHGFTASTFAVVRLEDLQEVDHLKPKQLFNQHHQIEIGTMNRLPIVLSGAAGNRSS
jgi:hypothetical protein